MDEMNPAYENFLNNMTRLGGSPRETTRKVSASSFLGRDNIAKQVALNSRKITILKNVIQAQQVTTGVMLQSLSTPTEGIDQSIMDIKETMSSILQTLEAQEKFEYEKFLDTQRRLENEKRRSGETSSEKDKPIFNFFKKQVEKTIAPVKNGFLQFIGFFINLIAGKIIMGILNFLSNPAMRGIVNFITGFIKNFFPLIVAGIGFAIAGVVILLGKMVGLTGMLNIAATLLGFGVPGGKFLKTFGGPGMKSLSKGSSFNMPGSNFMKSARSAFKPTRLFLQPGGMLEGPSHKDGGIPIEAEGGEFVVNKEAMKQPGAGAAVEMINSGNFSGLADAMRGMSGDEKLAMQAKVENFFNNPINQIYTETTTDSKGNVTSRADMSGLKRYQQFMKESGYEMDAYGFMPNVGKRVEKQVSGFKLGGQNVGSNAIDYFKGRGLSFENEINKNIAGTEAFKLNALSQSINESVNAIRIKGNNNISIPSPPIIPSNDQTSMPDFSNLPSVPSGGKTVPTRNELPVCSLNPSDSNKCDTLGMLAP